MRCNSQLFGLLFLTERFCPLLMAVGAAPAAAGGAPAAGAGAAKVVEKVVEEEEEVDMGGGMDMFGAEEDY